MLPQSVPPGRPAGLKAPRGIRLIRGANLCSDVSLVSTNSSNSRLDVQLPALAHSYGISSKSRPTDALTIKKFDQIAICDERAASYRTEKAKQMYRLTVRMMIG